jgi:hypothetical protein
MQSTKQEKTSYSLFTEVMTIAALLLVSPFVVVAFVPLALSLLPVAAIALPFMVVAFFGETKTMRPAQPVRQLRPHLAV